jgi:putative tryptophan/tyrosine transport system substrate-binding protein
MRRREFITLLGGAVAAWPIAARAQQGERMARIGVLMPTATDDPLGQSRLTAFLQALAQLGWTEGRNTRIDIRWSAADADRIRRYAAELVALAPDVILAATSSSVAALQQATRALSIIFVQVADPVGAGFVASLAQPGGTTTGFTLYEYTIGPKWLELLKEVAPRVTRAGLVRDASNVGEIALFGAVRSAAPAMGMDSSPLAVRDAAEIERDVTAFAREPNGGLVVLAGVAAAVHREQIIRLAARYRLPAVYPDHLFVTAGGLISYGPDRIDQFRRAASYVDRILKGEKPADLPVQAPTKYELAINLRTAKALGLDLPASVLARADEVIE